LKKIETLLDTKIEYKEEVVNELANNRQKFFLGRNYKRDGEILEDISS